MYSKIVPSVCHCNSHVIQISKNGDAEVLQVLLGYLRILNCLLQGTKK